MPLLIFFLLALLLPRVTIFLLWFFSNWFNGVFTTILWPLLGFILMPYTLLWYSIVINMFSGIWGPIQLLGLVVAVIFDLSSSGFGYDSYHKHYYVVEEVEEEA